MSRVPVTITVIAANGWVGQRSRKVYCVFELHGGAPRRTPEVVTAGNVAKWDQDLNFFVVDYTKTHGKITLMDATRETEGHDTEIASGSFNIFTLEAAAAWQRNERYYVRVPLTPAGVVEVEVDVDAELPAEILANLRPSSIVRIGETVTLPCVPGPSPPAMARYTPSPSPSPSPSPPPPVLAPVPDPELVRLQSETALQQQQLSKQLGELTRAQSELGKAQADTAR
eukprot:RCo000086